MGSADCYELQKLVGILRAPGQLGSPEPRHCQSLQTLVVCAAWAPALSCRHPCSLLSGHPAGQGRCCFLNLSSKYVEDLPRFGELDPGLRIQLLEMTQVLVQDRWVPKVHRLPVHTAAVLKLASLSEQRAAGCA